MSFPQIFAVGAEKRVGKDTLCDRLIQNFKLSGIQSVKLSLAEPLKNSCKCIVMNEFGIDIHNCSDQEKELVRPLLVTVAAVHRTRTRGHYFVSKLLNKIVNSPSLNSLNAIFVSDLRFDEYGESDELETLRNVGAKIIHLGLITPDGSSLKSNIESEIKNSPLIEKKADYPMFWFQEKNKPAEINNLFVENFARQLKKDIK